jgi:hypothetical protein
MLSTWTAETTAVFVITVVKITLTRTDTTTSPSPWYWKIPQKYRNKLWRNRRWWTRNSNRWFRSVWWRVMRWPSWKTIGSSWWRRMSRRGIKESSRLGNYSLLVFRVLSRNSSHSVNHWCEFSASPHFLPLPFLLPAPVAGVRLVSGQHRIGHFFSDQRNPG